MNHFNVLVIDDDDVLSKGLAEKLNLNGFNAECVLNGAEGIKKLNTKHGHFDAVICDLVMPGMYGDKVFEELQKIDFHICFIMLTGYGNINNAVNLMKKGACFYYAKPLNETQFEELFLTLRKCIISKKIIQLEERVISTLDINEIFANLNKVVEMIFPTQKICLAIIEEENEGQLKIEIQKGFDDKRIILNKGFVKLTLEGNNPILIHKIDETNYKEILPLSEKSKSLLSVPLSVLDICYGILVMESDEPNIFSYLEKNTIKQFGNAVAIALHNNKTYNQKLEIIALRQKKKQYVEYISSFNAMTHQFKTPLNTINLTAQSLLESAETTPIKEIKEGLINILDYSENAQKMIKNVLQNYKDEEVETNLSILLDKVFNLYTNVTSESIIIEWPKHFLTDKLICKANQISFVIQTIIDNAIDAIKKEKKKDGKIIIKSSKINGKLKLEFIDNGLGIKKDYHEKILRTIFSTKPDGTGNGIGLFLCKNFVESHMGNIDFECKPGYTNFFFTLPLPGIQTP